MTPEENVHETNRKKHYRTADTNVINYYYFNKFVQFFA